LRVKNPVITVKEKPTPDEARLIASELREFSESRSEIRDRMEVTVIIRDAESGILAGLRGVTAWRWLYISHVWVAESARNRKLGTSLVLAAETEAKKRGCLNVHLETFSFQALDFYLKLGYRQFAALEDFPPGHTRFFLRKSLS
jgi:GNAT superfamily N-acetyltransferase